MRQEKNTLPKHSDWVLILNKSEKRLIVSISFAIDGGFPKSCKTYHNMVTMFFNPDPACRLRLVPIEGRPQDLFNSCYGTDMTCLRAYC